MVGADRRDRPRGERRRGDLGEALGVDADHHLGKQFGVPLLQRHRTRVTAQRRGFEFGEHLRDVLVRPVLKQPREQQIADLQQGQVLGVVDLAGRQQPGGLEVQQGRGDHQERGGLVEFQRGSDLPGVGDELVGDLVQRYLGHVQPLGEDQLQQQVEGSLEIVQPDPETLLRNSV